MNCALKNNPRDDFASFFKGLLNVTTKGGDMLTDFETCSLFQTKNKLCFT